ncbi:trihelix transcription factor ENAP1-like [Gastrolobium bilobum]|uniref:trihelix transcription factor ENAP1-like n=1 Tax=Gastrolobium bilobum TaxID=150636 RepID=UPI002AB0939B|nr:trihelix transcription factor ENAP1-like [Gastrolobium bilobum]
MSSPPPPDPPSALPLTLPAPPPPSSSSTRRLPPPCWSHDETVAVIDAYRDKWYSLGRSNLKSNHWQDVADAVATRCPIACPPKTAVQCRHKMEKLRKRYRNEIQRARSLPLSRFNSSWVHFNRMHSMEKGPSPLKPNNNDSGDDDDADIEDQDLYDEFKIGSNTRTLNKLYRNGIEDSGSGGFRIRIPSGLTMAQPGSKFNWKAGDRKLNPNPNPKPNPRPNPKPNPSHGYVKGKRERDPMGEMVSAIKAFGDAYVRMEQMKMEMAREFESMHMEMEMKRTQMILESQHRIVDSFANAVSDKQKKKAKRMPSSSPQH